jgi:hypothetical protein
VPGAGSGVERSVVTTASRAGERSITVTSRDT